MPRRVRASGDADGGLLGDGCAAMEVCDADSATTSPVEALRELCGPADPEVARVLRSYTLRAKFGKDKIFNAVHCTDLEEDGPLEVTYFFDLLQQ
jgi:nucleoside-diphosphate kinase